MRLLLGLVALFLALAVGIGLGAGPLGDRIDDPASDHPTASDAATGTTDSVSDPVDAAVITGLARTALAGKLTGQSVAIVTLPGASGSAVKALTADITAAGGAVASTTALTEGMTAVDSKQLVDSLGSQLVDQVGGPAVQSLTTYPRMGALLGSALTTTAAPAAPGPGAVTIRSSLTTGDLVAAEPAGNLGTLTVVLTGTNVEDAILTGLITGLAGQAHGLVVSGDTNDGDVAAVRDAKLAVGTFDGNETAGGAVATTLLLARQITSPGGAFGASGSDGPAPLG
ncbi:copper transporter [Nocardioides sp. Kera G14]|uniref:copper transporter n=1 Tax=Nocardioides sp. Kera G14 TaxID=2884264 RepID=UPI001D1232C9|nr:copper transporter [Nocardioides sp. Kera G14]UDY25269.1 copper transporter [Nocardioides sp. Kera G14]